MDVLFVSFDTLAYGRTGLGHLLLGHGQTDAAWALGGLEGAREAEGPCAERGKGGQTDAGLALMNSVVVGIAVTLCILSSFHSDG